MRIDGGSSRPSSPVASSARRARRAGRGAAARPAEWPWATFLVNIVGAFPLGYFATRLQERLPLSAYRRPFLGTGFCGALTTFSTMQLELLRMLDGATSRWPPATRPRASSSASSPSRRRPTSSGGRGSRREPPVVLGIGLLGAVGAIARFLLDGWVSAR